MNYLKRGSEIFQNFMQFLII